MLVARRNLSLAGKSVVRLIFQLFPPSSQGVGGVHDPWGRSNPFAEVSAKAVVKRDRHYFIPQKNIDQIMAVCDPIWRTILGLARYGGLRCPSEVLSLRWELVDWEHNRMVVDSPKTEHHPEGAQRTVSVAG